MILRYLISTDIDECASGNHSCDRDAMCTNTEGSFNCACLPGSTGDGLSCGKYVKGFYGCWAIVNEVKI